MELLPASSLTYSHPILGNFVVLIQPGDCGHFLYKHFSRREDRGVCTGWSGARALCTLPFPGKVPLPQQFFALELMTQFPRSVQGGCWLIDFSVLRDVRRPAQFWLHLALRIPAFVLCQADTVLVGDDVLHHVDELLLAQAKGIRADRSTVLFFLRILPSKCSETATVTSEQNHHWDRSRSRTQKTRERKSRKKRTMQQQQQSASKPSKYQKQIRRRRGRNRKFKEEEEDEEEEETEHEEERGKRNQTQTSEEEEAEGGRRRKRRRRSN